MNLRDITKQIQYQVGAAMDGIYGPKTAAAILLALAKNKPEPEIIGDFDARTNKAMSTLRDEAKTAFTRWLKVAIPYVESEYGLQLVAIGGSRTAAEQNALYAKGRTAPGRIVTNAKAGQSNHNYGLALDMGLFDEGRYVDELESRLADAIYAEIAEGVENYGLFWGGNWKSIKDTPHFQLGNLSVAQMREKYPLYV